MVYGCLWIMVIHPTVGLQWSNPFHPGFIHGILNIGAKKLTLNECGFKMTLIDVFCRLHDVYCRLKCCSACSFSKLEISWTMRFGSNQILHCPEIVWDGSRETLTKAAMCDSQVSQLSWCPVFSESDRVQQGWWS